MKLNNRKYVFFSYLLFSPRALKNHMTLCNFPSQHILHPPQSLRPQDSIPPGHISHRPSGFHTPSSVYNDRGLCKLLNPLLGIYLKVQTKACKDISFFACIWYMRILFSAYKIVRSQLIWHAENTFYGI